MTGKGLQAERDCGREGRCQQAGLRLLFSQGRWLLLFFLFPPPGVLGNARASQERRETPFFMSAPLMALRRPGHGRFPVNGGERGKWLKRALG